MAALDATTGKQRWTLAKSYPQAELVAASPGALMVWHIEDGKRTNTLVRMSDGSKIADLGASSISCASDSAASIIACTADGNPRKMRVMTYHSGDAAIKVSKHAVPDEMITAVRNGYVFYGGYSQDGNYGAADYSGNVVSPELPGRAVAVTDKYAVFDTTKKANNDPGSFAVYGIAA